MEKREYKYKRNKGKGAPLDLIGQRFGRLVVTERGPDKIDSKSKKHKSQFYCDCDCGTIHKLILGSALTSGATRSCGCLHKEISSKNLKENHYRKYNQYDLSGDFGIGYTSNGEEFYFDLEDYEKIKNICWHMNNDGYIFGHLINNGGRIIQHRLINEPNDWQVVDHINGCKYDNRKSNLRNTSQTKNAKNRSKLVTNKSGKTGVILNKHQRWEAYITNDGIRKHLGVYSTFEEACAARNKAEEDYFGEFRRLEDEKSY